MLGPILSAVGGIASGLFGQSSADASIAAQKEAMQNRYQWSVADLKKAGLNPALAYGGMSSGGISGAQATMQNPLSSAAETSVHSRQARAQERAIDLQEKVAESQIGLNISNSAKASKEAELVQSQIDSGYYNAQTGALQSSAEYNNAQSKVALQRVSEIQQQIAESVRRVQLLDDQAQELRARVKEAGTRSVANIAQAQLSRVEAVLSGERSKTERLRQQYQRIETDLQYLNYPRAKTHAEFYQSPIGRVRGALEEFGSNIRQFFK